MGMKLSATPTKQCCLPAAPVELEDNEPANWDTLSIAAYRAGLWQESLEARTEKIKRAEANVEDQLYFAMTHWQLGNGGEAHKHLDKGISELNRSGKPTARLEKLRQEAEQLVRESE